MILRPGTFLLNRYEIIEKIGSGGMSDVYRARCHTLERFVAIKVLKDEFADDEGFVKRFKIEAQSAAKLENEHIVRVYDVVDDGKIHFIVMELIEGSTLKAYIARKGRLDFISAASISLSVALGIRVAHERGIIHRDIKPQNIILSKNSCVKVADFGIAGAASSEPLNMAIGSVYYISPEQAKGGIIDERSDIYSLGVTMYEMVCGRPPFEGSTAVSVALAHVEDAPIPPSVRYPDINEDLERIILRCIQKRPERRYNDIGSLIADLRRAIAKEERKESLKKEEEEKKSLKGDTLFYSPVRRSDNVKIGQILDAAPEGRRNYKEDIQADGAQAPVNSQSQIYNRYNNDIKNDVRKDKSDNNRIEEAHRMSRGNNAIPRNVSKEDILEQPDEERTGFDKAMTIAGIIIAFILVFVLVFIFIVISGVLDKKNKRIDTTTSGFIISNSSSESSKEDLVTVPDLTGMNQDLAQARLKELSLQFKVKESVYNDNVDKDYVISQSPGANEKIAKYSNVEVIVSLGTDKIDIKKLGIDKLTAENARNVLESHGVKVTIVEQFDDNIEQGMLIKYDPEIATKNGSVTLYSSKGKEIKQVKMPKLVGKTEAEVNKIIKASKLVSGEVKSEYNDTVPKGSVISQSTEENAMLPEGSKIDYVLSLGPKPPETTAATTAATVPKNYKYVASIDATYNISDLVGPGSSTTSVNIMIRLKQTVNGQNVYTTLMEPRKITGDTILPIRFRNIEGAYGVDQGTVEVVEADSQNVLKSYNVEFFKME